MEARRAQDPDIAVTAWGQLGYAVAATGETDGRGSGPPPSHAGSYTDVDIVPGTVPRRRLMCHPVAVPR